MSRYLFEYEIDFKELISKLYPEHFDQIPHAARIIDEVIKILPEIPDEKQVANRLNISQRALQKQLNKSLNTTFSKLARLFRVYYAMNLLYKTKYNNSEIAFKINYTEESSMARDFRVVLGLCPNETRIKLLVLTPKEILINCIKI